MMVQLIPGTNIAPGQRLPEGHPTEEVEIEAADDSMLPKVIVSDGGGYVLFSLSGPKMMPVYHQMTTVFL